jgi:N-acetylglucosamine kinase-like BadF-type ATPase
MANYYLGIDGGGSNLRVVITDDALNPLAHWQTAQRVNPNVIGYDNARQHIQDGIRHAIAIANVPIASIGLGIAGARGDGGKAWMRQTVAEVLPDALITPASDNEIALVGANGAREGILILAGTGSIVFGANSTGETCEVGGWGYLMGDEGSGYWLGLQALRAFARHADGITGTSRVLYDGVMNALHLHEPLDLLVWLYADHTPKTSEIAKLASVVLMAHEAQDPIAQAIITEGAQELATLTQTVMRRLNMLEAKIAFAGGLLEHDTALSRELCARLGLSALPQALHTPLIGAALLARIAHIGR